MSSIVDFVIESGILKKYKGRDKNVTIPVGVTAIDSRAFYERKSIISVVIPAGVVSIGEEAFNNCSNLIRVEIPESVNVIENSAFYGCESITEIVIPNGVTIIKGHTFSGCSKLATVSIPESVTEIKYAAFGGCVSLCNIAIPESVTEIGRSVFAGCKSLTEITIPNGVTSIEENTFNGCAMLSKVIIPESVKEIGEKAFFRCESLTEIRIPEGVHSIGDFALYKCTGLTKVVIPEGVKKVGEGAFEGCTALADKNGFVVVDDILFDYIGKENLIVIPENVKRINTNLPDCNIIISESVSNRKENFLIHEGVLEKYLGFGGNVTVPSETVSIGSSAFSSCPYLFTVKLPDSVTQIGHQAFYKCTRLNEVEMPDSIRKIGECAFYGCTQLTSLTIPENVTEIGRSAFEGCTKLTSIAIPEGVSCINDDTFNGCTQLTSLTIPENVTEIGRSAFEGCSELLSVKIPDSIRNVNREAFKDCKKIRSISVPGIPEELYDNKAVKIKIDYTSLPSIVLALTVRIRNDNLYFVYVAKPNCDNITDYLGKGNWNEYDLELLNNGPKYRYSLPLRLFGALGRLKTPIELSEDNRNKYIEFLNKNVKKVTSLAEELDNINIVLDLISLNILDEKATLSLKKSIAESPVLDIAILANTVTTSKTANLKMVNKIEASKAQTPLQKEYARKLKEIKGDSLIKKMKLYGQQFPDIKLKDGTDAPSELLRFIVASYGSQSNEEYHIDPEADQAADLCAYDSLCNAIDEISDHLDCPFYPAAIPLVCRFGNADQIKTITDAYRHWDDWEKYNKRGRNAQLYLLRALCLSDRREAIVWLQKRGFLASYAAFRQMTVTEVVDRYLCDLGLDKQGKRIFDLGTTSVTVQLDKQLRLSLFATLTGDPLSNIPAEGVEPLLYKKIKDEWDDMQRNYKDVISIKKENLLSFYLNGEKYISKTWRELYIDNPFLRRIASMTVWSQDGATFILSEDGVKSSNNQPYIITEGPIQMAHVLDMDPEDLMAWRKYFLDNSIKQPFNQIWEVLHEKKDIFADRYQGCILHYDDLLIKKAYGIDIEWHEYYMYPDKITLKINGFVLKSDTKKNQRGDLNGDVEIISISPKEWTRRTNAVIDYLDRLTIDDRIKKDDECIRELLPQFSDERIMQMLDAAQKESAVKVTALLLEYRNSKNPDYNPMDEFVLDW